MRGRKDILDDYQVHKDAVAAEYMYHALCYKEFVAVSRDTPPTMPTDTSPADQFQEQGLH